MLVKRIKSKFEWGNQNEEPSRSRHENASNIVQVRKKFYESYIDRNKTKSAQIAIKSSNVQGRDRSFSEKGAIQNIEGTHSTSTSKSTSTGSTGSYQDIQEEVDHSNMEKTPSKIVNDENICIYVDGDSDSLFGSFRKRPRFHRWPNLKGTDTEVMMRLKEVENEFQSIQRYESILRPPLFQQVIVSKHHSEIQGINEDKPRKSSLVATMVDAFNQQMVSRNSQENLIDLDLINSMRVTKKTGPYPKKPTQIFQELAVNRNTLWVETKQVQSKSVVSNMSVEKVKFMESQFELISSEASYNRSLAVLVDTFYNSSKLSPFSSDTNSPIIKPHQKEHLFSNVLKIFAVSSKFLAEMEKRFCEDIYMLDICDMVSKYADNDFEVYVPYIQNQRFQTDAYNALKKNPHAAKVISELESQPECCSLNLDSFLLLPMQRLLRILMLLKNIKNCIYGNRRFVHDSVSKAITHMEKIVKKCSDNKIHIEERQRMLEICSRLEFKNGRQKVNISIGKLLLEGEVKRGPKNSPRSILPDFFYFKDYWFILTSEYLLMTKTTKSKDVSYVVEDYFNLSKLSVKTDCNENDKSVLEFKLFIKKPHNYDSYVVLTKSRQDWVRWRDFLTEYSSGTQ